MQESNDDDDDVDDVDGVRLRLCAAVTNGPIVHPPEPWWNEVDRGNS
jgi:hypothetical protein